MNASAIRFLLVLAVCISAGCANIVPPTGGVRDRTPPKLVSVEPADSLLNEHVSRIDLRFDEYINLADASKEVQISPILAVQPTTTSINKKVTVKIADTLLEPNTTYRVSFGSAIKDVHEGNVFGHYTYTFSTGSYFDSLQLTGNVLNAATGLPDSGVYVVLYSAAKSDSAVVREKPKYITKAENNGSFTFKGLPGREFKIYALKDKNGNLIYDGAGEMVGFIGRTVTTGETGQPPILLRMFAEPADTSLHVSDTGKSLNGRGLKNRKGGSDASTKEGLAYTVGADTANINKRTLDITVPLEVAFSKEPKINAERINLAYDSVGISVEALITATVDTGRKNVLFINTAWKENTVYTLRLLKGFAKDSAGADAMPSRFTFRTKDDDDYGKIRVNVPGKYYGKSYLVMVMRDKDTVYTKPVTDTALVLTKLKPGNYSFRIIYDKNENGKWDTGNLLEKLQPEDVIPYPGSLQLKSGWEHTIDFEQKQKAAKGGIENIAPPVPK